MGLKTFNVDEALYKKYSGHCKREGISMSKRVETFIRQELEKIESSSVNNNVPVNVKPIQDTVEVQSKKHSMQRYC